MLRFVLKSAGSMDVCIWATELRVLGGTVVKELGCLRLEVGVRTLPLPGSTLVAS